MLLWKIYRYNNKDAKGIIFYYYNITFIFDRQGGYNISCYIFIKGITINFINIKKSQLFIDFVYKSYYKEAVLAAEKKLFKRIIFDIKILKI